MLKKFYLSLWILLIVFSIFCSENKNKTKSAEKPKKKVSASTKLVFEVKSKYSHIRVRDLGTLRQMFFVRDNGEELLQSMIDTNYPQNLFLLYSQKMFASMLINKEHKDILLIGLGGGAMVHFLNHYFPNIKADVLEIDPAIVDIAKKYFQLKEKPSTRILIEDAMQFIASPGKTYDVIYMDAFLKPTEDTDSSGVSNKFKSDSFFQNLKARLKKNGIVAFNVNESDNTKEDIAKIQKEFTHIYIFQKTGYGNLIVIGSTSPEIITNDKMKEVGEMLDKEKKVNFSFLQIANFYKEKRE